MRSYCKRMTIDYAVVEAAYGNWAANEAGKKNKWRVERDYGTSDNLIAEIVEEIRTRRLTTEPIRYKERIEPTNGKVRITGIECVKQQVLNYVAVYCIRDFTKARLGFYQAASVPGKSHDFLRRAIKRKLPKYKYWVKTDIRKCFPSIKPDDVEKLFRKYIKSDDVLYVVGYLLSTYKNGLNVGSYFACVAANIVLSFAYHHVEQLGKIRRGKWISLVGAQFWHMDDALFLGNSKRDLKRAVRLMSDYLNREWGLTVKPWKVCLVGDQEPPTMGGYAFRPNKTTVCGGTFIRARRSCSRFLRKPIVKLARRVVSYNGRLKHSDCRKYMLRSGFLKAVKIAKRIISKHDRRVYAASLRQPTA